MDFKHPNDESDGPNDAEKPVVTGDEDPPGIVPNQELTSAHGK